MWNFLLFFSQYNFLLHFIPLEEFSSRNFLILLIKLFNFNEDDYFLSTCIIGTIITVILLSLSPRQTILQFLIPLILKKHTVNRHVHYCRTIIFKFHPKSVHLSTVAAKILGKILKEKSWRVTRDFELFDRRPRATRLYWLHQEGNSGRADKPSIIGIAFSSSRLRSNGGFIGKQKNKEIYRKRRKKRKEKRRE